MKNIPSIFLRDWDGDPKLLTSTPNPECAWVFAGEGVATLKRDGTSCMIQNGHLYKRYDVKPGKVAPEGFIASQEYDPTTGHHPGWVPVSATAPEDRWHREALANLWGHDGVVMTGNFIQAPANIADGTYELLGPKLQGNPEGLDHHFLWRHGSIDINAPTDYEELKKYLETVNEEGVVWHHPDGRMAKIKTRDFGLEWPRKS